MKELTEQFESTTKGYYEQLKVFTNAQLEKRLKRHVDERGRHPTLTGNKDELIARLFEMDYVNFVNLFHPIRDFALSNIVDNIWKDSVIPETPPPRCLGFSELSTLRQGVPLAYEAFIASIILINNNDRLLCRGFNEVYAQAKTASIRQESFIVHPSAAQQNLFGTSVGSLIAMGVQIADLPHLLYIPLRLDHALIVVDFSIAQFIYYGVKNGEDPQRTIAKAEK